MLGEKLLGPRPRLATFPLPIPAGDPFFGAQVKDTTTKHTRTSSCFQKNPPAKGKVRGVVECGSSSYSCALQCRCYHRASWVALLHIAMDDQ